MKNTLRRVVFPLFIAIMVVITGMQNVQAKVEKNWPAGTPNEPKNPDDIFLDFEDGIERLQIESTVPSLEFSTTNVINWRYGDMRRGYNSRYAINGNFFAWLGEEGDAGRIDFIGGGATYCSVLVSTHSGVVLEAYDSSGISLGDSGWASDNLDSGTMTRLTVEAPKGKNIDYVLIHDTGNYWLMDDLCTDANKVVIPLPGRSSGASADKFDIVFVPDKDYGSKADIDTWLPTFLDHVNGQIDDRLGAADPVTGNLCKFNFYYTKLQGTASSHTLPTDLTRMAPYAQAFVILHQNVYGDSCIMTTPSIYGAEGAINSSTQNGRSFIHESGHGLFGLADEYDGCGTHYFQPNPQPNIWDTEALCQADATKNKWDPDFCDEFTECQGGWWMQWDLFDYIMKDGTHFDNGWGEPAEARIQWVLDQYPSCTATKAQLEASKAKSIWLNINVSYDKYTLEDESYLLAAAPNYLPGTYDFTVKVFSDVGGLLQEFGVNDARRILGEEGYTGPGWLDEANFQIIVPYFRNGARVDFIETATGRVKLSVDISQYMTEPECAVDSDCDDGFFCNGAGECESEGYDTWDLDKDGDVDKEDSNLLKNRQKAEKTAQKVLHKAEKTGMKEASCDPHKDHHCFYDANFDFDGDFDVDKDDSNYLKNRQKAEKTAQKILHKAEKTAMKAAL